jgi:hypothetical protein
MRNGTVAGVADRWHIANDDTAPTALTGEAAAALVRDRIARGLLETWLEHDDGPRLAISSNGTRALVMFVRRTR